jgi:8-oxo-dGTP pyrophosphatase MutT (NUDIX family)
MIWKPNVVVAAIIEQDGKFLLVEEETEEGVRFNQPAGHWEPDESLHEAVIREVHEETAYEFTPEALLGIYYWRKPNKDLTYLRFAFIGKVSNHHPDQKLDTGIIRAVWMTTDEIRATSERHRSPLIVQCVNDYLAGKRYPLDVITGVA